MIRYYFIGAIAVFALTAIISFLMQTKTRKEIFMIMISVTGGLILLTAVLAGGSHLLVWLGIAKSGLNF